MQMMTHSQRSEGRERQKINMAFACTVVSLPSPYTHMGEEMSGRGGGKREGVSKMGPAADSFS